MVPDVSYACFAPPTLLVEEYSAYAPYPVQEYVEDLGKDYPTVDRGPVKRDGVSAVFGADGGGGVYSTGSKGYSYSSMGAYARAFYKFGNPDYAQWPSDCTNFVSQCMKQGHWASIEGTRDQAV